MGKLLRLRQVKVEIHGHHQAIVHRRDTPVTWNMIHEQAGNSDTAPLGPCRLTAISFVKGERVAIPRRVLATTSESSPPRLTKLPFHNNPSRSPRPPKMVPRKM